MEEAQMAMLNILLFTVFVFLIGIIASEVRIVRSRRMRSGIHAGAASSK
jgi:hypothetical protein